MMCVFDSAVKIIDYVKLILVKKWVECKGIYVWSQSYKSELNNKFQCKNQFLNQKLQFLASSRTKHWSCNFNKVWFILYDFFKPYGSIFVG